MVSSIFSATLIGIEASLIEVETQLIGSLKKFTLLGLPDSVLKEAKDRVRCAIENSGFQFPNSEIIVSLTPTHIPKRGSGFDLAIALGILAVSGVIPAGAMDRLLVLGELSLDGRVKPVQSAFAASCLAVSRRDLALLIPQDNGNECKIAGNSHFYGVRSLSEAVAFLRRERALTPGALSIPDPDPSPCAAEVFPTFQDVVGQHEVKRAFEVAAAGGHNLLMLGPPGGGKSMMASRLGSILPPLDPREAREVLQIYSAARVEGEAPPWEAGSTLSLIRRPFRNPHHAMSSAALVGGGAIPVPGEISLAHKGVLFLDEFAELRREAVEALREPLESRAITVSRAMLRIRFPADFILVAAMNPCPCGYYGDSSRRCSCSVVQRQRYKARVSGPVWDRIDLQVWVPPVPIAALQREPEPDCTPGMRLRVAEARSKQRSRLGEGRTNADMRGGELRQWCRLSEATGETLFAAAERLHLSARAVTRILKVGRTIADLAGAEEIQPAHLAEALFYRLDSRTAV